MTALGESIKGGCAASNDGGIGNTQLGGSIGGGVPSWIIIGWGAITAVFTGMMLRSRKQQPPEQKSGNVENPFPKDSEDSEDKKPTSD